MHENQTAVKWLLLLVILINCLVTQGVFEWTVVGKVTDYGQNVTLFCNVPNCCPYDAGWDRWTPVQQTLIIDVKSGQHNKKYDGKVLKDGYTLVIQNLTKHDLNASYSCLYDVTVGEIKFLQEEDVFTFIGTTHSNVPTGDSRLSQGEQTALITGVFLFVLVSVTISVCLFKYQRDSAEKPKNTGTHEMSNIPSENEQTQANQNQLIDEPTQAIQDQCIIEVTQALQKSLFKSVMKAVQKQLVIDVTLALQKTLFKSVMKAVQKQLVTEAVKCVQQLLANEVTTALQNQLTKNVLAAVRNPLAEDMLAVVQDSLTDNFTVAVKKALIELLPRMVKDQSDMEKEKEKNKENVDKTKREKEKNKENFDNTMREGVAKTKKDLISK